MVETALVSKKDTRDLVSFLADLKYGDIPPQVVERTKLLFLDWLGSCLAGGSSRQVKILSRFSNRMCRHDGPSEVIPGRSDSSPFFASFINAASSHVVELDDLYDAAVIHPGTVVFPAALAAAQENGASGKELLTASIIGYEAAARVGEFLGRSHYRVFHTTGTAGTFGAASAVSHILGADFDEMLNSFGSAGTQAAGLWEFLKDAADSKQLHTAKAASNGLLAAYISHDGFTGAKNILEGSQGLGAGTSTDADKSKLSTGMGEKWAVMNTSLKYYAACRHIHPSADALPKAMKEYDLSPNDIRSIKAHVHQAAIDVLGPVTDPKTIHQSKFSMQFVLSLIALTGKASLDSFNDLSLHDQKIRDFMRRVELVYDEDIDRNYPSKWKGFVEIETFSGKKIRSYIDAPKGDPENFLTEEEIFLKFATLAKYSDSLRQDEIDKVINKVKNLENIPKIARILN